MATKIDIANLALSMISANTITSFEDDSDEARLVRLHYPHARDATLEAQEWTFALKRFNPVQDASPPLFGYARQFVVPSEIIRVITCEQVDSLPDQSVSNIGSVKREQIEWELEKDRILTNEEKVNAIGIERIRNEGDFSPLFVHALAAKLAFLMAYPLTQSSTIVTNAAAMYESFIAEAKSRDGIQGRSRRIRQRSLARSR